MVTDLLRYLHFDLCFTLWTLFRRCLYWRTCASLVLGQGEASIQDRGKRREGGPPIQDRGKAPHPRQRQSSVSTFRKTRGDARAAHPRGRAAYLRTDVI